MLFIAPFRMQPGLRRLAADATHLTPSTASPQRAHLREKLAVLQAYPQQALLASEGFDAAPALDALARHASQEHPHAFVIQGDAWLAPRLGWGVEHAGALRELQPGQTSWPEVGACLHALPAAWRRAALLLLAFEEDFAIVDGLSGTIPWLAVALPSHWAPERKVGRTFSEVHAPVADNALIVGAAAHLVQLVTAGERWERFVWTVAPHPRLHAHPDRIDSTWPSHLQGKALAAQAWLRTERQTFLPVQGLAQAVFTIHVSVQPLAQALHDREQRHLAHDAVASMSDAVLAYRGLTSVRDRLLQWLSLPGE